MRKNIFKMCFSFIALLLFAFVLIGCKKTNVDGKTHIKVHVLNRGYGITWMNKIIEKFELDNPTIKVDLEATANEDQVINKNINSKKNDDDLYISVGVDWMTYAAQGKFAELDDIMEDLVDGVKLKDKVSQEYRNSIYYPDSQGKLHTYRLPWIKATGGIFYNKKMFENNGWRVPTTYQELLDLCETIVNEALPVENQSYTVAPFVYTGQNTDYFDYAVYTWWAQLAGEANIKEFLNYSSASNFDSSQNSTYAKLKEATSMWQALIGNTDYVLENCSGLDNHDAQRKFARGEAAMMFNSDWIYNEILGYEINSEEFELALMKTPTAPNAVEENILYTIGEDQYFAIPATSTHQVEAKALIKLIVSDFGCKTFLKEANGLLAYDCNYQDSDATNSFTKNLLNIRSQYTKAFTNYPKLNDGDDKTTKFMYLSGLIDIWFTGGLRPYENMLKGTSLDKAFSDIAQAAKSQWDSKKQQAGL